MSVTKRTSRAIGAISLAAALVLSGCGSNDDQGVSADGDSSEELLQEAQKVVDESTSLDQEFPIPSEAAPGGGKKIAIMAGGFAAAIHADQAKRMKEAADAAGATVLGPYDGEFTPSVQAGHVDQAVQAGADAIVLFAVDVNTIDTAVQRALDDGVTVACALCTSGPFRDKGVVDVTPDFEQQGEVAAYSIIARTEGKAKVLVPEEPAATGVVARVKGAEAVFDKCGGCSIEKVVIPSADLAQPGPPQITAFLSANSGGFTDLLAYADALAMPVLTTLESTGTTDLTITSYDAEQTVLDDIEAGNTPVVGDVAAPMEYAAWAAVDQGLRGANGLDTWDSTDLPDVLITKDNVGDLGAFFEPKGDWKAEFTKLWKS